MRRYEGGRKNGLGGGRGREETCRSESTKGTREKSSLPLTPVLMNTCEKESKKKERERTVSDAEP